MTHTAARKEGSSIGLRIKQGGGAFLTFYYQARTLELLILSTFLHNLVIS